MPNGGQTKENIGTFGENSKSDRPGQVIETTPVQVLPKFQTRSDTTRETYWVKRLQQNRLINWRSLRVSQSTIND